MFISLKRILFIFNLVIAPQFRIQLQACKSGQARPNLFSNTYTPCSKYVGSRLGLENYIASARLGPAPLMIGQKIRHGTVHGLQKDPKTSLMQAGPKPDPD